MPYGLMRWASRGLNEPPVDARAAILAKRVEIYGTLA